MLKCYAFWYVPLVLYNGIIYHLLVLSIIFLPGLKF